jgi:hypothetical protein
MKKKKDPGLHVVPNFSKHARALRADYDARFGDPLKATTARFVWDYWNLPGQYTLLRSPPGSIFAPAHLAAFLDELALWAQTWLGLSAVSEPWLSCYVEGCEQRFHTDAAHGPWAFVYSLTPNVFHKKARGGYTRISNEFGGGGDLTRAREEDELFTDVRADFNRLIVFDPRRPHAVERVTGVQDVREGRLVVHGWFTDPQPFYDAKLAPARARSVLEILQDAVSETLADTQVSWQGLGVLRVGKSGRAVWLSSLLVNALDARYVEARTLKHFLARLQERLDASADWRRACAGLGRTELTLPFECTV